MGIHKLLSYIKNTSEIYFPQFESKDSIYISNVIYFDMTYKLIEIYNSYMKMISEPGISTLKQPKRKNTINPKIITEEVELKGLLEYIAKELTNLFEKLINYNRAIYVFVDYRFSDSVIMFNLLFKNYVELSISKKERLNYIPMIKREYIDLLKKDEITINSEIFINIVKSIRCQYELTSKYEQLNNLDITEYISLNYLIRQCQPTDESYLMKLEYLLNIGKFRYMILRGAKWQTKKHRSDRMFSFFSRDEYVENNINKTLINVLEKEDYMKLNKWNKHLPFNLVLYCFPLIMNMIKTKGVYYLGCEVESDFAIVKHVKAYSRHSFPTIYTNDSDLLVLLNDVDCIVKLNINSCKKTYLLNPVKFWQQLFGCQLSCRLIKIMCVLLGTDYNPYSPDSPIHIKNFKEILTWLKINKYEEIDEDLLLVNIYMKMKENPNNKYCQQTARALNIYLNDIEYALHYISENEARSVNVNGFLKLFRSNCLRNEINNTPFSFECSLEDMNVESSDIPIKRMTKINENKTKRSRK